MTQKTAHQALTPKQCLQFSRKQTVNPITLRTIQPYKHVHNQLMNSCRIKNIAIQIIGLGCTSMGQDELERYKTNISSSLHMPCHVYCNQSLLKTLYDVSKTCIYFIPSKKNKFVQYVLNEVKILLDQGYNVFLMGHSYGGSVASRIAEIVCKDPQNTTYMNRLTIITLGSIYVPRPEKTQGVNIKHYMFENDVALKCNKLGIKNSKESHVIWLQQRDFVSPSKKKKSIFGTKEEWKAHNSYNFVRQIIFNTTLPVTIIQK